MRISPVSVNHNINFGHNKILPEATRQIAGKIMPKECTVRLFPEVIKSLFSPAARAQLKSTGESLAELRGRQIGRAASRPCKIIIDNSIIPPTPDVNPKLVRPAS